MHRHESRNAGDRFVFSRNGVHKWTWERVDRTGHVVERSACSFADHADCVANAIEHGYLAEE